MIKSSALLFSLVVLSTVGAQAAQCPNLEGVYQIELDKVERAENGASIAKVGGCVVGGDKLVMSPVFSHSLTTRTPGQTLAKAYVLATDNECVFEVRTPGNQKLSLEEVRAAARSPKGLGGGTTWINLANYLINDDGNLLTASDARSGFNPEFQTNVSSSKAIAIMIAGNGNLIINSEKQSATKGWFGLGSSRSYQSAQCVYQKVD
ncbi:MAG: hypothetical protein V4692_05605 [Bdellovibrionota bacterium]